ncbi:MAG: hypothetical protein IJ839_00105 [Ruminobacter sp.]|jgi:hypothetical protein|nr:hypothetical protein [Ruminobacter sp.]
MKFKKLLPVAVVLASFLGAGCSTSHDMMTPSSNISGNYTSEEVKKAIISASVNREWIPEVIEEGVIEDTLIKPGCCSATIRVHYTNTGYTINYVNSRGLGERGGKIHRNYNRWVNNLDKDIQKELRKTSALR